MCLLDIPRHSHSYRFHWHDDKVHFGNSFHRVLCSVVRTYRYYTLIPIKKTYRTIINLVNPCLLFKSNNYIINPQITYMLYVIDLLKLNCQSVISPDKKEPCHWKICCKIAMQLTFCTVQTLIAWSTAIQTCAIYMMASFPFQALPTRHFTFLSKCTTITRCNYMNSKTGN